MCALLCTSIVIRVCLLGISSAAGMRNAGRSAAFIFWRLERHCGRVRPRRARRYVLFAGVPPAYTSAVNAVAAGAILAMIADTMIPEAFEAAHEYAGLVTASGFLAAFALTKLTAG